MSHLDRRGRAVAVTGTAQREAWRQRVLPPVEQVRPDLWSVPVPIPDNPLRYTLSYVFLDDAGAIVVDPGWDSVQTRDALIAGLATIGTTAREVAGVVVTHMHPDHHGLSGWLRETAGAWIAMHPAEAASLPARVWHGPIVETDRGWLRDQGVPEADVDVLMIDPVRIAEIVAMAEPDRYLDHGDALPLRGRDVRAIWTPGHTPGHICLRDAAAGVLLTGDHLLPRISPNISVHSRRDGDPLTDYLASLGQIAAYPDDEALPAHEYRFANPDVRAAELIAHHDDRSAEILTVVATLGRPTSWQIATQLSWARGWDALQGLLRRMALSETIAHLSHLATTGRLVPAGHSPARWTLPPR